MKFSKWQGLGNDFIIPDEIDIKGVDVNTFAQKICDRNFGVGADGLCLLESSDIADMCMRLINSDGSEAEMCGNLMRCVAKHLYLSGICKKEKMQIETLAGIIKPELIIEDGNIKSVKVDMGAPRLKRSEIPMLEANSDTVINADIDVGGMTFTGTAVSMGNPHFVIFVDDMEKTDISLWGPQLEHHRFFPARANIEFVQVLDSAKARMRVWERGAGITMACGTGSCATLVAGVLTGRLDKSAEVILDGGSLKVEWPDPSGSVFITGDAEKVFSGELFRD